MSFKNESILPNMASEHMSDKSSVSLVFFFCFFFSYNFHHLSVRIRFMFCKKITFPVVSCSISLGIHANTAPY